MWFVNKLQLSIYLSHLTLQFTAEISDKKVTFLDTIVYKGARLTRLFDNQSILELMFALISSHWNLSLIRSTSLATHQAWKQDSYAETLRLLRTNSSKIKFEEYDSNFKVRLKSRGYPNHPIDKTISDVIFTERQLALEPKLKRGPSLLFPQCSSHEHSC